ncbi:type II secretion system protein [Dasania sp. GY-19]|uniref:Type II secretion system protein n=2 Tax=Spongiibacteraceae TaxID=1706375 RepID=A0A9J6RLU4_9GAMM|nr:type II secretion system protein [Dasania phycosphaerae]MCZ0869208.1 type II secretion system protein [Dasania phycosphaerae]
MNKNMNQKGRKQAGFTLIELVVVIVLIALLAAQAMPRFSSFTEQAEIASLEGMAGGFVTGINIARATWLVDGYKSGNNTSPSNKTAINLDGKIIYMNESGWPVNTDPASDASEDSQTATECVEVWLSVMQTAPAITTNPNDRVNAKYFASVIDQAGGDDSGNTADICRYELIVNAKPSAVATHYFDYDLADGEVTITKPNLN